MSSLYVTNIMITALSNCYKNRALYIQNIKQLRCRYCRHYYHHHHHRQQISPYSNTFSYHYHCIKRFYFPVVAIINVVKFVLFLLLLFMTCNCNNFATALEFSASGIGASAQQSQQQSQPQQQPLAQLQPLMNLGKTVNENSNSNVEPVVQPSTSGVAYDNATLYADNQTEMEDSTPSEIQKAVCTVNAGDVRASAEAVTTKTLKGVCSSAELKLALGDLEAKIYKELQEIKMLLQQLVLTGKIASKPVAIVENELKPQLSMSTAAPLVRASEAQPNFVARKFVETLEKTKKTALNVIEDSKPKLKSLTTAHANNKKPSVTPREQEVLKFNNTMLADRDFKVFTYYWKLENFTQHIEAADSAVVESPIFSIKGKLLHVKAYFQHLHRDFLYLQLEHASSILKNNQHNIIMDMGGLFREIENEKVKFKHKITILDQNNQRFKDLVSQEFNNLDKGFLIPNSALLSSPYIKNNALLIQIFLYL